MPHSIPKFNIFKKRKKELETNKKNNEHFFSRKKIIKTANQLGREKKRTEKIFTTKLKAHKAFYMRPQYYTRLSDRFQEIQYLNILYLSTNIFIRCSFLSDLFFFNCSAHQDRAIRR